MIGPEDRADPGQVVTNMEGTGMTDYGLPTEGSYRRGAFAMVSHAYLRGEAERAEIIITPAVLS